MWFPNLVTNGGVDVRIFQTTPPTPVSRPYFFLDAAGDDFPFIDQAVGPGARTSRPHQLCSHSPGTSSPTGATLIDTLTSGPWVRSVVSKGSSLASRPVWSKPDLSK